MNNLLIQDIITAIEAHSPLHIQEEWDNCGVQVGKISDVCTGVLLCVDATPDIIDEAIEKGCNLVISHHPILFKGLKRITGHTLVEQTVIKAITAGVTIYSCHTAIDNATNGVSWRMAQKLGLTNIATLDPQVGKMLKLSVIVPNTHADIVKVALFNAGAGQLGNYESCSFSTKGEGSFKALDGASPFVGDIMEYHIEPETRIDVILPRWLRHKVETAMIDAHPYEEPAYEFIALENSSKYTGSGVVAQSTTALTPQQLIENVKATFSSPVVRCNAFDPDMCIKRIAMCGGAGAFMIPNAIKSGVQAFITSDTRYHDFVDYAHQILIIDIGHFESEQYTKEIFYHVITEKFPNFAVYYSEKENNPINYL